MPTTDKTNLKVIKVGVYRMFFIFISVSGLVFFGASQNLIVFAFTLAALFGWVIFELNVVLQAVIGVQRIMLYAMQPQKGTVIEGKPEREQKSAEIIVETDDANEKAST